MAYNHEALDLGAMWVRIPPEVYAQILVRPKSFDAV